ncbi:hypothetical protein KY290_017057 [Solanum tuberosum]|uniref:Gag-pol polyprotein n=1 Tax=Solanum tuberosum TaxID=4113 RepID=A0ABQ7VA82_SOLTU|nr:hypothetical protein KY284_016122 [Solanum tuberosum]KAH0701840.1 hypothetical protein KY285_016118 [Solanum tuberosum]KAH0760984.1 hypothetical protein KY290_017057 [Solanum tuberosum]
MTTVSNVQSRFEIIANETDDMDDNRMVRLFISELRDDIKNPVLVHKPKSYEETLNLAHIHEQQIQAEKGPVRPTFAKTTPLLPTPNSTTLNQNISSSLTPYAASPSIHTLLRRLTNAEVQSRRERGLCYYCKEK